MGRVLGTNSHGFFLDGDDEELSCILSPSCRRILAFFLFNSLFTMVGMVYIQFYVIASNQGFVQLFKLVLVLALFSKDCSDTLSFLKACILLCINMY